MNQIPPNEHVDPASEPHLADNPYTRRAAAQPQLDETEGSPYLRADDVQRLNRKALLFLGVIVVVLAGLAAWIFSGGLSSPKETTAKAPRQEVVIPAAPRDLPALPPERSAQAAPPMDDLPPLPVTDERQSSGNGFGMGGMNGNGGQEGNRGPSLVERRMGDARGESEGGAGAPPASGAPGALGTPGGPASRGVVDGPTSAQPLYKPNTLLLRGTYIRCVLQARVISDFPGYTSCVVTEPVYSVDGQRLLLPRGSKVQGSYGGDGTIGNRVAIVWDRITTPTGLDINMSSPGVDMLGSAGAPGYYNAHWGQRIASSLLISILADGFKYAAAENGPETSTVVNGAVVQNPYESATARNMERLANMAMERNMSRPPTVTINQGTIVNVYVARDVDFSSVIR